MPQMMCTNFINRWCLAILRNTILAAIPVRLAANNSTLLPSQCDCGRARNFHRVQNVARTTRSLDPDSIHGLLRSRPGILLAPEPVNDILGLEHARGCPRYTWSRHELRGRCHLHHEFGAA
jgi:hypothetical protein